MFPEYQNGISRYLACASGLRGSHDRGWVVSRFNRAKTAQQDFVLGAVKRRNRPRSFHALVEIQKDRPTPVVRLSAEPPRVPNESTVPPVIHYNRITPGEVKETQPNKQLTYDYFEVVI